MAEVYQATVVSRFIQLMTEWREELGEASSKYLKFDKHVELLDFDERDAACLGRLMDQAFPDGWVTVGLNHKENATCRFYLTVEVQFMAEDPDDYYSEEDDDFQEDPDDYRLSPEDYDYVEDYQGSPDNEA